MIRIPRATGSATGSWGHKRQFEDHWILFDPVRVFVALQKYKNSEALDLHCIYWRSTPQGFDYWSKKSARTVSQEDIEFFEWLISDTEDRGEPNEFVRV